MIGPSWKDWTLSSVVAKESPQHHVTERVLAQCAQLMSQHKHEEALIVINDHCELLNTEPVDQFAEFLHAISCQPQASAANKLCNMEASLSPLKDIYSLIVRDAATYEATYNSVRQINGRSVELKVPRRYMAMMRTLEATCHLGLGRRRRGLRSLESFRLSLGGTGASLHSDDRHPQQDFREASRCAQEAIAEDPTYLPARRTRGKILEELGMDAAARQCLHDVRTCEGLLTDYESEALALCETGFLSLAAANYVYNPARFAAIGNYLQSRVMAGHPPQCEIRASVVPWCGGQVLLIGLAYVTRHGRLDVIPCITWYQCDTNHGNAAMEPPNGHATRRTLEETPHLLRKVVQELRQRRLVVVAVMCGQGLYDHTDVVESVFQAERDDGAAPFPDVIVYRPSTTHASVLAGRQNQTDERMVAAQLALGLRI